MTPLKKPIRRRSEEYIRDGSKMRRLIVVVYPSGFIGLRPEGTRREETITIKAAWEKAVAMRVVREQRERDEKRAAKLGMSYGQYVRRKRR